MTISNPNISGCSSTAVALLEFTNTSSVNWGGDPTLIMISGGILKSCPVGIDFQADKTYRRVTVSDMMVETPIGVRSLTAIGTAKAIGCRVSIYSAGSATPASGASGWVFDFYDLKAPVNDCAPGSMRYGAALMTKVDATTWRNLSA